MTFLRFVSAFILLATSLCAQNPFAAQAPYKGLYQGTHANAAVSLRLVSDAARYTGTLSIGPNHYTLQAKPTPGQLTGEFYDESGNAAPFICSLQQDGEILVIKRRDGDVRLKRIPVPDNIWGHWKGEGIDLYLSQPEGSDQVSGMIFFQGGKFPLSGRYELGQLEGLFKSSDQTYPFQVQTKQADQVHFISGPFAQQLTRQTAESFREAHQALVLRLSEIDGMKPLIPFIRQEVIAAHILLEELQNALPQAEAERDALAWAEIIARSSEMKDALANLNLVVDTFKPRVSANLFREAGKINESQPTDTDKKKAFELMLQSAELGYSPAMLSVSNYYKDGTGVEQNFEKALHWYHLTANCDVKNVASAAQNSIGLMHYRGQGVNKDSQEALKWFQRAADNGHTTAGNNLKFVKGELLYDEALDLRKGQPTAADKRKSFDLMLQGAEIDHGWSMFYTAKNYEDAYGVKQDYAKALEWYRRVAELDHSAARIAQNNIGIMYLHGKSVPVDRDEALKWLQRAADNGLKNAADSIAQIKAEK